jgi:hypothetical protein
MIRSLKARDIIYWLHNNANHIHTLIGFRNTGKSINTIIGNGKRFMAYDIVKQLEPLPIVRRNTSIVPLIFWNGNTG